MPTRAAIAAAAVAIVFAPAARGQGLRVTSMEIVPGQPLGIGKVTLEPSPEDTLAVWTESFELREASGRILYPVVSQRWIDRVLEKTQPEGNLQRDRVTFWFLFRGSEPLQAEVWGGRTHPLELPMSSTRPAAHRRLMRQWWREYVDQSRERYLAGQLPPLIEAYLVSMLARRFNLEPAVLEPNDPQRDPLRQTIDLVFDTESLRAGLIGQWMSEGFDGSSAADQRLPPTADWGPPERLSETADVPIEPIARGVPAECFYLRFGSWENQLWLSRLLDDYGGDLSRLIQLRGHRARGSSELLRQLALSTTRWEELFGGRVIADLALIGSDLYVADGPSMGVLFQSRGEAFRLNLERKREQFAAEHAAEGVTLELLEIEGCPATKLSSDDQATRSYFISQGDLHLVATSHTLCRRFVQALRGEHALADGPSFRLARELMPLSREDTLFLFASEDFFHQLLSPHYQIELRRRARERALEQLLQLAELAARREGIAGEVDAMRAAGLLPPELDAAEFESARQRAAAASGSGSARRLPILDEPLDSASPDEVAWYQERARFFQEKIGRFDPLMIAVRRYDGGDERERLVVDARIAPFAPAKYDWLGGLLGSPTAERMVGGSNDLIALQVSLQRDFLTGSSESRPYQLYAAVQDEAVPPPQIVPTTPLQQLRWLQAIPGYLAASPRPDLLVRAPLGFRGPPDAEGFTYSRLLRLWRLEDETMALVGFDRQRLQAARAALRIEPDEARAQLRLKIGDLAASQLRPAANAYFYERAWQSSVSNVRLVHQLSHQFGLPANEAWETAERLIGAEFVCPLGGTYQRAEGTGGERLWQSTAWPDPQAPAVPPTYEAAFLQWFRGLEARGVQTENQFVIHAVLDVQRLADERPTLLPSFDLFRGFFDGDPDGSVRRRQ